jgi:hypothetical protein
MSAFCHFLALAKSTPFLVKLGNKSLFILAKIWNINTIYFHKDKKLCGIVTLNYFCAMQYFNLHTHQFTNQSDVLELVNQYPQEFDATIPFYSIGIHPLYIDENRLEKDFQIVEQKLALPVCLALGECGLDKRSETPFGLQQVVLEKQLALAEKHQKPVVIHCVAAICYEIPHWNLFLRVFQTIGFSWKPIQLKREFKVFMNWQRNIKILKWKS